MIEAAEKLNRYAEKCFFHVNLADDLGFLDDDTFDLVMSMIALQYVPKRHALKYIADFVRVARLGRLIVFQVPDSMKLSKPGAAESIKDASPESGSTRREPEMIMSGISYAEVTELLEACGAHLLDALEDQYAALEWLSYKCYATKRVTAG